MVAGNGRAAIIKEYGNLSMGSVVILMLGMCLWQGLGMGQRFLDSQIAVFNKMVENQVLELEQDKRHYEQIERIFERINGDC